MLCIASFIVFLILGVFSTYYRSLAKKAWGCVGRRVTFRPCDTGFASDVKGKLFGKMMFTHPKMAKFLEKWVDVFAFFFVVVSLWSVISVGLTGLNLWVYDTCNPAQPASCSLSGEACAITSTKLSLSAALEQGRIGEYVADPFVTFIETVSRIPERLTDWKAEEYISSTATYYTAYNASKPIAVEVIDPSCTFCKKLFENIKQANFDSEYNLTYVVYPIPDSTTASGYKFPHSYMMASYLEALKTYGSSADDWKVLEKIFTGKDTDGVDFQTKFVSIYSTMEAEDTLQSMIRELGYNDDQILAIQTKASSTEVQELLLEQKRIVEDTLKTLKIPTIVFDGRRYDRVVDVNTLK